MHLSSKKPRNLWAIIGEDVRFLCSLLYAGKYCTTNTRCLMITLPPAFPWLHVVMCNRCDDKSCPLRGDGMAIATCHATHTNNGGIKCWTQRVTYVWALIALVGVFATAEILFTSFVLQMCYKCTDCQCSPNESTSQLPQKSGKKMLLALSASEKKATAQTPWYACEPLAAECINGKQSARSSSLWFAKSIAASYALLLARLFLKNFPDLLVLKISGRR